MKKQIKKLIEEREEIRAALFEERRRHAQTTAALMNELSQRKAAESQMEEMRKNLLYISTNARQLTEGLQHLGWF